MKFTKEEVYKELVAAMTAKGEKLCLSDRSFNEQLETLIPLVANDETELKDFVEKVLPIFRTADSNVRHDVSVSVNEYKKNNPVKDSPIEKGEKNDPNSDLLERIKAMEHALSESKKQQALSSIRENLVNEMKKKGIKDDDWIDSFVSEVNITEDFDVEAKSKRYLEVYNKMNSKVKSDITPGGSGGSTIEKDLSDFIKGASDFVKSQRLD